MKKKTIAEKHLPDLPKIALAIMKGKQIKRIDLAHRLGWVSGTVTALFNRRDWHISEVKMVGNAIDHDMIQYLYPNLPEGMIPASAIAEAQKEIEELKKQLAQKEKENLVLQTENNLLIVLRNNKG